MIKVNIFGADLEEIDGDYFEVTKSGALVIYKSLSYSDKLVAAFNQWQKAVVVNDTYTEKP